MCIRSIILTNAKRLLVVISLGTTLGCAIIDVDQTHYMVREKSVLTASVLDEITAGATSSQWLINHLGTPDYQKIQGTSVIYQYAIKEHRQKQTRVLVFYRSQRHSEDHYYLNVELADNVVQSYWKSHQL